MLKLDECIFTPPGGGVKMHSSSESKEKQKKIKKLSRERVYSVLYGLVSCSQLSQIQREGTVTGCCGNLYSPRVTGRVQYRPIFHTQPVFLTQPSQPV